MLPSSLRTLLIAAAALAAPASIAADEGAVLAVRVTNLRSDAGRACVDVFDAAGAEGYPDERRRAFRRGCAKIEGQSSTLVFSGLPPGAYAAFAFHDEDGDGRLRTNLIGMPKEGVGASRGAKGFMGPPDFEDAAFFVGPKRTAIRIRLRYL